MKKRTLAALLGTLTALSSVAPTMAQAAENTEEYTVTFCRTQDSTMESDIFSILKDEKIEKEVKQIEGRIKRTKTKRNKLADGYLDGIIPQERLRNYFLQSLSF